MIERVDRSEKQAYSDVDCGPHDDGRTDDRKRRRDSFEENAFEDSDEDNLQSHKGRHEIINSEFNPA